MTTDWKALCAELVDNIHRGSSGMLGWTAEQEDELLDRARAALSQPEPEGPTVMEIIELANEIEAAELGQVDLVRAALARWGRPTPQPTHDENP